MTTNLEHIRRMNSEKLAKFIEEKCKACYIQDGIYANVNNILQKIRECEVE